MGPVNNCIICSWNRTQDIVSIKLLINCYSRYSLLKILCSVNLITLTPFSKVLLEKRDNGSMLIVFHWCATNFVLQSKIFSMVRVMRRPTLTECINRVKDVCCKIFRKRERRRYCWKLFKFGLFSYIIFIWRKKFERR